MAVSARAKGLRAGGLIGILSAVLGFALVVQVRSNEANSALPTARQEDLVRILDDLNSRDERLQREITSLEQTKRDLGSGVDGSDAALEQARTQARDLGILAGTVPASGPGIVVTISEPGKPLTADVILDAVEELRGAGAEAMQIRGADGTEVRIVASTSFVDGQRGIVVDGRQLRSTYTLVAIGDGATMEAALNIPGGVVNTVGQAGATISVDPSPRVAVTSLASLVAPQYARPVP